MAQTDPELTRRKERFFQEMARGYAQRTAEERAEDDAERALWDRTIGDGIQSPTDAPLST